MKQVGVQIAGQRKGEVSYYIIIFVQKHFVILVDSLTVKCNKAYKNVKTFYAIYLIYHTCKKKQSQFIEFPKLSIPIKHRKRFSLFLFYKYSCSRSIYNFIHFHVYCLIYLHGPGSSAESIFPVPISISLS